MPFTDYQVLPGGHGAAVSVRFGRATEVVESKEKVQLVIIYEHLISAEPATPKQRSPTGRAAGRRLF